MGMVSKLGLERVKEIRLTPAMKKDENDRTIRDSRE
jgi:hypothetical protein